MRRKPAGGTSDMINFSVKSALPKGGENSSARSLSATSYSSSASGRLSYSQKESGRTGLVHDLSERVTRASRSSTSKRMHRVTMQMDLAQLNIRN